MTLYFIIEDFVIKLLQTFFIVSLFFEQNRQDIGGLFRFSGIRQK